jgi:hypothetical protein
MVIYRKGTFLQGSKNLSLQHKIGLRPGANPTIFEFTATTPAL